MDSRAHFPLHDGQDTTGRTVTSQPQDHCGIFTMHGIRIDSTQVLDNIPDGITIQDRTFTVIYQNAAMLAAFGNRIGMKCYVSYERRDTICDGCGVTRAFETGEQTLVVRTAFDAQGGTSWWENACFPIRNEKGEIVAGAEICRNISDREGLKEEVKRRNIELGQLNRKLRARTDQLTEAFQQIEQETLQRERAEIELRHAQKLEAVGQLAAGIAHEINTPTQFVNDNLHFLADSFKDLQRLIAEYRQAIRTLTAEPGHEAVVEKIGEAENMADLAYLEENVPKAFGDTLGGVGRIAAIVGAMKDFAHPDYREKSPSDLNRALESTLIIAKNEYKYVADVETDFGDLPPVTCHLGDMNQVFLNLIVNAAHAIASAGRDRGTIRVRTARDGENVRIEIEDTGCGIPESIRDRVFEPFFTTKEVGRGTGQGLAIAHSIVADKHGGSLTFRSEVNRGTTFTIRLPANGSQPAGDCGTGRPN